MTPLERAIVFATERHTGQFRKGLHQLPYIVHPLDVMGRLLRCGVSDQNVLAAAVLHDVMEDCGVTRADLEAYFNRDVGLFVEEVTVPQDLDSGEAKGWQEKRAPHMSYGAKLIRISDKASNLEDLVTNPPGWDRSAVIGYATSAHRIVSAMNFSTNQRLSEMFNIAYFRVMFMMR